ncbi:AtzG-like protein [Symbiopectobacterium sp.]
MCTLLNLLLTPERHDAVLLQLQRIAEMAQPLMDYPLEMHEEIAGVYQL